MRVRKWLVSVTVAVLGGGIAGSVAALSDPAKYSFPRDLGTGKMWPFFLSGSATAIGAMLIESPLVKKSKQPEGKDDAPSVTGTGQRG